MVLFVGSTLVQATHLSEEQMSVIPLLVITWSLGRILFAYGYNILFLQQESLTLHSFFQIPLFPHVAGAWLRDDSIFHHRLAILRRLFLGDVIAASQGDRIPSLAMLVVIGVQLVRMMMKL